MIYLKYDNFQTTNIIPMQEKIIGTVGSNNSTYRIFSLPKTFNELDLSEEDFTFILQINPIEKSKDPYFQILEKTILEDSIELKWVINNSNTSMHGNLEISIKAQKEENNIIWESNILTFEVLKGIDALDSVSEIPPNIMEQYILQAANHAERSVSGANLTFEMIQNFEVDLTKKADLDENGKVLSSQLPSNISGEIDLSEFENKLETIKNNLLLKADLDESGKILLSQLPTVVEIDLLDHIANNEKHKTEEEQIKINNLPNNTNNTINEIQNRIELLEKTDIKFPLFFQKNNNIPILSTKIPDRLIEVLPISYVSADVGKWTEIARIKSDIDEHDIELDFTIGDRFSISTILISDIERLNTQYKIEAIDTTDNTILASSISTINLGNNRSIPLTVKMENIYNTTRKVKLKNIDTVISVNPAQFGVQFGMITSPENLSFINTSITSTSIIGDNIVVDGHNLNTIINELKTTDEALNESISSIIEIIDKLEIDITLKNRLDGNK